jgi:hypothetical protein
LVELRRSQGPEEGSRYRNQELSDNDDGAAAEGQVSPVWLGTRRNDKFLELGRTVMARMLPCQVHQVARDTGGIVAGDLGFFEVVAENRNDS